ncbi:UDP-N-acetylglucosamine 1-carboxyvinyltransferase [Candidatus Epulonipiscium viviparus]|uniref:UDP-N-acetylglucosamine 1-carboxyvinyltransferase n=1 Tax=Candidatus Epulonipiscium viviparus TaxID=420336 RepID=UPI000496C581|nr:UDP-N-acetylglucosamine 1-carboxyvinyltransferase [Candidatus Epulopiscium viviparus]
MSKLCIQGDTRLVGDVKISGAKNAAVAILPATILVEGITIIENLPNINDVAILNEAIVSMGAVTKFLDLHTLEIDATTIYKYSATEPCISKMRASYYLLGALLGRFKKAEVAMPGGCDFGGRPIDQHIKGFRALGANIEIEDNIIKINADRLIGTRIYLDMVSVGATINIMLAAVLAEGTTTIENAAKEPHIVDVANFLNKMGAKIIGAGTDVIRIKGVSKLHGGHYNIVPDQIEAGTFMLIAAATKGDICVRNIIPEHMDSLTSKLREIGVTLIEGDDYIRVIWKQKLTATQIITLPYPGFPTDLQPQMLVSLLQAQGVSTIVESIFDNRFQYVDELRKMGANITIDGTKASIEGVDTLYGANLVATDLRAGAAMIIAGLVAKGTTTIDNVRYIDRGYEDIEKKLTALGAQIFRID